MIKHDNKENDTRYFELYQKIFGVKEKSPIFAVVLPEITTQLKIF
jgi:hypothetical protein